MKLFRKEISATQLVGGSVLAYLMISQGFSNVATFNQQAQTIAQQRQKDQIQQASLLATEQKAKALEQIANDRYDRGCEMVFSFDQNGNLTNNATVITEGQPVLDASRRVPLSEGVIVCGRDGTTARIAKNAQGIPVATDLAFTGDRNRVAAALRRYRGAQYNGSANN